MRTSACHLGHQPIHTILGLSNQFCSDPKMEKKYVQLFFYFKREKVQSDRANVCIGLCNPCSGIILVFFLLKLIGSSRGSSECRTWIEDPHHCEWKLQTSIMAVVLSIISLRIWFNFFICLSIWADWHHRMCKYRRAELWVATVLTNEIDSRHWILAP